jgi:hypothetical protein
MLRAVFLGTLALACAFAYSLLFSVPGWSAGLHPRCNIDWPCVIQSAGKVKTERAGLYDRIARADRYRNVEFGAPMYPPETARSFLARGAQILPHPPGGGRVLAYDANSGRRLTRLHVRSLAGFVVVDPHG